MASSTLTNTTLTEMLRSKFRGALLGALVGDCMGDRFESAERPRPQSIQEVADFFATFRPAGDNAAPKPEFLHYTDDTAMTKVLARSLCTHKRVDVKDLAINFTKEFYGDPKMSLRNYGLNVVDVFRALTEKPYNALSDGPMDDTSIDFLKPSKSQFKGTGSFGNGAAMRVTPVALFYHDGDREKVIESCKASALVTHAHADGYNGAILLGFAIQQALKANPQDSIEPVAFVEELRIKMKSLEAPKYDEQLLNMKKLFSKDKAPSIPAVVDKLGNDVTALRSVPIAIYSFLRVQQHSEKPISEFEAPNQYERTIQYAISLGGDTDTIGCMAGACCGAHVGEEGIPEYLIKQCEAHDDVKRLADDLVKAIESSKTEQQQQNLPQSEGDEHGVKTKAAKLEAGAADTKDLHVEEVPA